MGCQTEVEIGANLTFTVATHNQGTGALVDADSAPAYRIYEDETGAPILTGNMAKLDDAGTLGFYSEIIAATIANGFEKNKSYSIYITIIVSGVTYAVTYGFRAITTSAEIRRNAALVESQRGVHTWQGSVFYVDSVNGDTHANGNRGGQLDPYDSVQDCHDNAITDSAHDVIILVAGAAATVTTLTEAVTLSKRYLFIRGPGRDLIWTRSGNGNTITITADGIELSGFQLETAGTGSGHGISTVDADFFRAHNLWINQTRGDGINVLRGSNHRLHDNVFQESGQSGSGQGIHIIGTTGVSNYNVIEDNIFEDVAGHAIQIEQGTSTHTLIRNNTIHGSSGYGINIGASSTDAFVHDNRLGINASGPINDEGTTSVLINNEDVPSKAEMDAAHALLATVAKQNAAALINTEARLVKLEGLPEAFPKNVAATFMIFMRLASDSKTRAPGLTVTATRAIDNGALGAITGTIAEVGGAGNGAGWYYVSFSQADLNGDVIAYSFDGGVTADVLPMTIRTVS